MRTSCELEKSVLAVDVVSTLLQGGFLALFIVDVASIAIDAVPNKSISNDVVGASVPVEIVFGEVVVVIVVVFVLLVNCISKKKELQKSSWQQHNVPSRPFRFE